MTETDFKSLGNASFAAREFDKAIEFFSQGIKVDANNHVLYSNRSAAYTSLKNYKAALLDADKTVELNPTWPKGYSRKGAALFGMGDFEGAKKAYQQGLEHDPENEMLKGAVRDVDEAMQGQSAADGIAGLFGPDMWTKMATNPKLSPYLAQPDVVAMLTECQRDPKKMSECMKDQRMMQIMIGLMGLDGAVATDADELERAKEQANKDLDARATSTTNSFTATNENQEITPEMKQEKEKQKKRAESDAEKVKGSAAYKTRDFEAALDHYSKAWVLDESNIAVLTNKSAVLFEMEKYDECIAVCTEAVEKGREVFADFKLIGRAFGRIGSAYQKLNDYPQAIKYFQKSLAETRTPDVLSKLRETEALLAEREKLAYIDPEISNMEREKGNELFKNHEYPAAVKCYTEAIKRNPQDARNYSNRAASYTKLMALPEAERDCDQAISIDPVFIKAYIRKAAVQFAKREFSKCIETCNLGMEKDVEGKNHAEMQAQIQRATQGLMGVQTDEGRQEALKNPEVQEILGDPVMQQILRQMQQDPSAIREHMKNPGFAKKMQVLIDAGVVQMGSR